MAIKKSELYTTLWKSCDELRGGMDASQYKDYVLVMLFVKYVSDKAKTDPDFIMEIPQGCSFDDFINLKGKDNIGEQVNKKISALAEANHLGGVINVADFCDEQKLGKGKDLIDTLSNLIGIFQSSGLDFGKNRAADDDLMGDAYEYLMKNFATESGKSKGQFYTPAEVSRIMAKATGLDRAESVSKTIYDPTCGSGSLLLRALAETPHGATIYGQEKDSATAGLAKMNMILHSVIDADIRQGVFMIDAKAGFAKAGPKNRLREQDVRRIVDVWMAQQNVPHYARFVENEEIERNDYNLNIPRYIESEDTEVLQDIDAHLNGGLPAHDIAQFQNYWTACPNLQKALFIPHTKRMGYFLLHCETDNVRNTIRKNTDFIRQTENYNQHFAQWCRQIRPQLEVLTIGTKPKNLIKELGDSILAKFNNDTSLVNVYDVYGQLLDYWNEILQDDCYLIAADGWKAELYTPQPAAKKGKDSSFKAAKEKKATTPDEIVCDLLPVSIVIDEYFGEMKALIQTAEERLAENETQLSELQEEQADNYLDPSNFADDKINDGNLKKRLKVLNKKADAEEIAVLEKYLSLKEDISETKRILKVLKYELLVKLTEKYPKLTTEEIKRLVIEKKWFAALFLRFDGEMQRISQNLNVGITSLTERYAETLPQIDASIANLESSVNSHLSKMGFSL
ncbi:hypothetical protein AGMMS50239_24560 [Bacteroidia bacterium]|nr:hypothetical protein AGMMS50239_24560 [Bacteroidia bacterium]